MDIPVRTFFLIYEPWIYQLEHSTRDGFPGMVLNIYSSRDGFPGMVLNIYSTRDVFPGMVLNIYIFYQGRVSRYGFKYISLPAYPHRGELNITYYILYIIYYMLYVIAVRDCLTHYFFLGVIGQGSGSDWALVVSPSLRRQNLVPHPGRKN